MKVTVKPLITYCDSISKRLQPEKTPFPVSFSRSNSTLVEGQVDWPDVGSSPGPWGGGGRKGPEMEKCWVLIHSGVKCFQGFHSSLHKEISAEASEDLCPRPSIQRPKNEDPGAKDVNM